MAQSKHRHQVFDVLKPVLKDLVAEIQRSIGYYKSLSRDVKFEEVLVMGEGFKLHGLHRFLQEQLQYRVRPLTELRDIQYAGPADREEEFKDRLLGLPVAIGLAIQGLRQAEVKVDLLPEDFVLRRELSKKRIPAVVAAGLLWLTMLFFYVAERAAMSRIKDYQDLGTEQVKKAEALANSHSQAQGTVKMSDLNRYRDLGQCRDYWAQAVAGLVRAIPQNPPVYIDSISLIGGDTSIGAGREGGRMEGPGAPGGAPAAGAPAGAKGFRFRATSSQLYGGKFDLASLGDLTTTVTCLLKPKTDIAADIEKVRQERAAKAAQEPAKAEVAAQGAKEPAKPK
jgi:hypothetical protein